MDLRWTPLSLDSTRAITFALYAHDGATSMPAAIVAGLVSPLRDLTPFVSRARQSDSDLTVTLTWHDELYGANMPQPGQWIAASLNGLLLCIVLLEAVNDYRLFSGERSMTLVGRSRDATSVWRNDAITTPRYTSGTPLSVIAEQVAVQMGMDAAETDLPASTTAIAQPSYQATNITAWDLVTQCLMVDGLSPFVDALGRLRAHSRDVLSRAPDVALSADRVLGFVGSKARAPIERLVVKWRSPTPVKVTQSEAVLGTASVQAGFWARSTIREIYWSEDRTQQADLDPGLTPDDYTDTLNSRLFVKNDMNNGIVLDLCDQYFIPIYAERPDGSRGGCIGGRVVVNMTHHRDDIISTLIANKLVLCWTPDGVRFTETISIGRLAEAANDAAILTALAMMGTGVYEVRGRPYDLVHVVNQAIAYAPEASPSSRSETVETDLCVDEAQARAIAAREFIYRVRAASSFTLTLVDDPRIEVGDLVALEDGTRLLVTGFTRDLSPGSSGVVELSGFVA